MSDLRQVARGILEELFEAFEQGPPPEAERLKLMKSIAVRIGEAIKAGVDAKLTPVDEMSIADLMSVIGRRCSCAMLVYEVDHTDEISVPNYLYRGGFTQAIGLMEQIKMLLLFREGMRFTRATDRRPD